eukprot:TRINITY_DN1507_c0_g1_i3.p1 TRINITY_DN1507_c0_g1~~TRINITY_DN1507_c0_g1_i3.p1  ORF type:complete len:116 (-),score=18.61 TRINITY_DN1507_c0_g1_i3:128-475(-)
MEIMLSKGVTGLGIVDGIGKFIGNFSAQDLAGLYHESLPDFHIAVKDFVAKYSPKSLSSSQLLRSDCTLGDVIHVMVTKKYHRVWLVDDNKPTGVVTMSDVIKFLRDYKHVTQQS